MTPSAVVFPPSFAASDGTLTPLLVRLGIFESHSPTLRRDEEAD